MKKIMVVDDDPAILEVMRLILEMENYEVLTSYTGSSLLNPDAELPDLLLLDIWMPEIDGKTLCKELKSLDRTKNLPIVIISAIKNIEEESIEAGADAYLAKPFDVKDLLAVVRNW